MSNLFGAEHTCNDGSCLHMQSWFVQQWKMLSWKHILLDEHLFLSIMASLRYVKKRLAVQSIQKTVRRVLSTFNISTKHISSEDENSLAVAGISLALKTKYDMNGNQIVCQHSKHHQWRCDFKCCEGDICWSYSKTSTMIAVHMQYTEQSEARSKSKIIQTHILQDQTLIRSKS